MYTGPLVAGVGVYTFVAAAMIAQLTASMATRDALFLSHFSPTALPYVMGASAVLSLAVVALFSRALQRWSPDRAVPAAFTCSALLFAAEWAASEAAPVATAVIVYLHTMALGGVLVSGFWTLMTERFDPHTAKRVFGRIGAGASIGGVLGGLGTSLTSSVIEVRTMLLVLALANVVPAITLAIARRPNSDRAAAGTSVVPSKSLGVPYLRYMAALVVLGAIADVSLDYAFKARVTGAYATGDLMQFFALFYTLAGVVSFLLQALVARPLLQNVGLTATLATQPVMLAVGSIVAMLAPGLWPTAIARGGDGALRTSLFKAGYELLYTPLTPQRKRAIKTQIDVGFSRLGGFAGSLLVLGAVSQSPEHAVTLLLGLAATAAAFSVVLLAYLHRGYVAALVDSLMHSAIQLDPSDVEDATTRKTVVLTTMGIDHASLQTQMAALRAQLGGERAEDSTLLTRAAALTSTNVERVRAELAREPDPALVAFLLPLLTRDELVEDVTRVLRQIAPRVTGQLVDALLDSASPALVRKRVPRILVGSASQRAIDGLQLGLAIDSYDTRHRCARALERLSDLAPSLQIDRSAILAAVRAEVGRLGSSHDAQRLEQIFVLLGLVLDRRPLKLAQRALASADRALRGTGLEYLENVVPDEILHLLMPHIGSPARPTPPQRREREQIVDALVKSVAALELEPDALDDEVQRPSAP